MRKRKVVYVTGTRADFGLMTPVLQEIIRSKKLELQLYVTGMHIMKEFGFTKRQVLKFFPTAKIINAIFTKDDRKSMAAFGSTLSQKLIEIFIKNSPDITLTLGDRMEMLQVAVVSNYLGIPTAQIHGGDKTQTVDEIVRHAITKLSHLHFPATKEAGKRIERMGEDKWRINVVGAPALDTILNTKLPNRKQLFKYLGINESKDILLVTMHPVTVREKYASKDMQVVLDAISKFDIEKIVVYPNADAGGREMIRILLENKKKDNRIHSYPNVPYDYFLALEREAKVWVGNSSAGCIESSSFATPVINVGDRQKGRLRGENVIDVGYNSGQIESVIRKSLGDKRYLTKIKRLKNPWGDGKAAKRIVKVLETIELGPKLLVKQISY